MKTNYRNTQRAFEYAIYMMAGSYYKKAKCVTRLQEEKLKIPYWEEKNDTQYTMEDMVIDYIEQKLVPELPTELWEEEVNVHLVGKPGGELTEIQFWGTHFLLQVIGVYQGKRRSRLEYQYCERRNEQ